jgi:hypothetical protein
MKKSLLERIYSIQEAQKKCTAPNILLVGADKDAPHLVVFNVLTDTCPVGKKGERVWTFLTDAGYEGAKRAERHGELEILKHTEAKRADPQHRARKHDYDI